MILLPMFSSWQFLSTTSRMVALAAVVLQGIQCHLDTFCFHTDPSESLLLKASLPLKKALSSLGWIPPLLARAPTLTS